MTVGFLPFASNGLCHVNGKKNGFAIYATGCGSSVPCTNGIGKKVKMRLEKLIRLGCLSCLIKQ